MSDAQKRTELAEFLRTRRQRANTADFDIAVGRRRRTAGLRREEVAQRANVSVAWYTFLEQGRPVRASAEVLDSLSSALHLDRAEREHLYLIARGHPPADAETMRFAVDPYLQQVLDAMAYPAYAALSDWTIAASNAAARVAFLDCTSNPGGELNILKMVFCDPVHRRLLVNWEQQAQDTLALFRASTAHSAGENWHKQLVRELSEASREFRMWWPNHDVRVAHGGPKEFNHPVAGRMVFQPLTMRYEGEAPLRLIVKVPLATANTEEKLNRLLAGDVVAKATKSRTENRL
jgi:transcriptional regulator with XRE-family HTH domain